MNSDAFFSLFSLLFFIVPASSYIVLTRFKFKLLFSFAGLATGIILIPFLQGLYVLLAKYYLIVFVGLLFCFAWLFLLKKYRLIVKILGYSVPVYVVVMLIIHAHLYATIFIFDIVFDVNNKSVLFYILGSIAWALVYGCIGFVIDLKRQAKNRGSLRDVP